MRCNKKEDLRSIITHIIPHTKPVYTAHIIDFVAASNIITNTTDCLNRVKKLFSHRIIVA